MSIDELYEELDAGIKDLEADYGQEVTDDMVHDLATSIVVWADSPATAKQFLRSI